MSSPFACVIISLLHLYTVTEQLDIVNNTGLVHFCTWRECFLKLVLGLGFGVGHSRVLARYENGLDPNNTYIIMRIFIYDTLVKNTTFMAIIWWKFSFCKQNVLFTSDARKRNVSHDITFDLTISILWRKKLHHSIFCNNFGKSFIIRIITGTHIPWQIRNEITPKSPISFEWCLYAAMWNEAYMKHTCYKIINVGFVT